MNKSNHICSLSYCKIHSQCIFKNAESLLKSDAHIVALGVAECSDRILCYEKENIFPNYLKLEPANDNVFVSTPVKECVKCSSKNNLKYHYFPRNPRILLCKDCDYKIHQYKSNHDLARYFNSKTKIVSLLNIIGEIEKQGPQRELIKQLENHNVIRCCNIYCGTDDNITKHHLIPKPYRRALLGPFEKIPLCRTCHDKVHRLKTNRELAKHYNTKEAVIGLLSEDVKFRSQRMMYVVDEQYQYTSMVA